MNFFATAAKGTEPALRDELRELRVPGVRADRGGVHFGGSFRDAARVCLWSRIAVRVLQEVGSFPAQSPAALYEGVSAIAWETWFTPRHTLAVKASSRNSVMLHTQFLAQKTKDAIVDRLRDRLHARPSVDLEDPDVRVQLHLQRDHAMVYLDLSGDALHQRGWRSSQGPAPLKETLAAAIVRMSGWSVDQPFLDPMCGAGTLPIEAAMWSANRAPNLRRSRFGVERWASHDDSERTAFRELREDAQSVERKQIAPVLAWDLDAESLEAVATNARSAGVRIETRRVDAQRLEREVLPSTPGHIVLNPPYGERVMREDTLYATLASALGRVDGWMVTVLAGAPEIMDAFAVLKERAPAHALFNGPIECRLLRYESALAPVRSAPRGQRPRR